MQDEAQVPGIPHIIQLLHLSDRLFGQFPGLTMDRWTLPFTLPYGIELTTAKRSDIINEAGVILFEKGTGNDLFFLFLQPILRDPLRDGISVASM